MESERKGQREGGREGAYVGGIAPEELKVLCTGLAVVNDVLLQHLQEAIHYARHRALVL